MSNFSDRALSCALRFAGLACCLVPLLVVVFLAGPHVLVFLFSCVNGFGLFFMVVFLAVFWSEVFFRNLLMALWLDGGWVEVLVLGPPLRNP